MNITSPIDCKQLATELGSELSKNQDHRSSFFQTLHKQIEHISQNLIDDNFQGTPLETSLLVDTMQTALQKLRSLGEKEGFPQKELMSPFLLKNLFTRDSRFQNCSPEKRAFLQSLTTQNLAALIGDSYCKDKINRYGAQEEGVLHQTSIHFFLVGLKYLGLEFPQHFEDKEIEIASLKQLFSDALHLATLLDHAFLETDLTAKGKLHKSICLDVKSKITSLDSGKSLLLPWGWSKPIKNGHEMLLLVTKENEDLDIAVINTGDGLVYHNLPDEQPKVGKTVFNTLAHYRIPAAKIEDFYIETLPTLFEPKLLGGLPPSYTSEELYRMLLPYRVEGTENLNKTQQQSSSGGFKGLMGIYEKWTQHAKELKFLWEQKIVEVLLEYRDIFFHIDPYYGVFLHRTLSNLYRNLEKLQEKGLPEDESRILLDRLDAWKTQVDALYAPTKDVNPHFIQDPQPRWEDPCIANNIAYKKTLADTTPSFSRTTKSAVVEPGSFHVPKFTNPDVPIVFDDFLTDLNECVRIYQKKHDNYGDKHQKTWREITRNPTLMCGIDTCRRIANLFVDPAYQEMKQALLAQMKTVEQHHALIDVLKSLVDTCRDYDYIYLDPSAFVYMEGIRLALWEVGVQLDDLEGRKEEQRLDFYGLDYTELRNLKNLTITPITFPSIQVEKDYAAILNAYETRFSEKKDPLCNITQLFDPKYSKATFDLDPKIPEYRYIATTHTLTQTDQEEALKEFARIKTLHHSFESSDAPSADWIVGWALVNKKLPRQFLALYSTSEALQVVSPTSILCGSSKRKLAQHISSDKVRIESSCLFRKTQFHRDWKSIKELFIPDEKLSIGLDLHDSPRYPIVHEAQNTLISNISNQQGSSKAPSPLYSIESINHPLNISMLFDHYRTNLDFLDEMEQHIFFETILHAPFKLTQGLKDNPLLEQDCLNFFEEALTQMLNRKLKFADKEKCAFTEAFLIEQKVRTLVTLIEAGSATAQKHLLTTRANIRSSLQNDQFKNPDTQILLQMALIETYATSQHWKPEECAEALTEFHHLQELLGQFQFDHNNYTKTLSPFLFLRINKILASHIEDVDQWIKTDSCKDWMQAKMPETKVLSCSWNPYPLLSANTEPKTDNALHVWTGKDSFSQKKEKLGPSSFSNFARLFGDRQLEATRCDSGHRIMDTSGDYHITYDRWNSSPTIKKLMNNEWHTLLNPEYLGIPESESAEWCIWMGSKSDSLPMIYNNKGELLGHISAQGEVFLTNPANVRKRYATDSEWSRHPLFGWNKSGLHIEETDAANHTTETFQIQNFRDPCGAIMEFTKKGTNWHWKSDSSYFISHSQYLEGLNLHGKFLILENIQGDKIAFMPECLHLSPTTKLRSTDTATFIAVNLNQHAIMPQKNAYANCMLAYHVLQNAKHPTDYQLAMTLLENAKEFRAYTPYEMIMLWHILLSNEDKRNDDPEAYAVRLYADYLFHDNLLHFPQKEDDNPNAKKKKEKLPHHYSEEDKLKWHQAYETQNPIQTLHKPISESYLRKPIVQAYLRKRNNIPYNLRLEHKIPPHELKRWGYFDCSETQAHSIRMEHPNFQLKSELNFKDLIPMCSLPIASQAMPTFMTRPGKEYQEQFPFLYQMARSSDPKERQQVYNFIYKSSYGINNWQMSSFLFAVLEAQNPEITSKWAKEFLKELDTILELDESARKSYFDNHLSSIDALNPLPILYYLYRFKKETVRHEDTKTSVTLSRDTLPPDRTLPTQPLKPNVPYRAQSELYDPFHNIGKTYFIERPTIYSKPNSLFPLINDEVAWLNKEYIAGYQKNLHKQQIATQFPLATTKKKLIQEKDQIQKLIDDDIKSMEALEKTIVSLGNHQLQHTVKGRTLVGANKLKLLTLDGLIHLITRNDSKEIAKAILQDNPISLKPLINNIGQFLEYSMRKRHAETILKEISLLSQTTPSKLNSRLNIIQDLLETPYALVAHPNPLVQLTYQHFMHLNVRPNQVNGLNIMRKLGNHTFIQAPTGDGKTLVWAQLMAYYNATGESAAVHVSPPHQFASNLYEMADRSKKSLGQNGYPFIFYDTPLYNNEKYLKTLEELVHRAIEERAYLHTTPKILRALRAADLYSSLEYWNNPKLSENQKKSLQATGDIIRRILALLRKRGRIVFDEIDEAQSPNHVYHKGIGSDQTLDEIHLELMALMLRLGMESKKEDGTPLIGLKKNTQAQTTEKEKAELINVVVEHLTTDSQWLKNFGCEDFNLQEQKELKNYLTNKRAKPPKRIQERIQAFKRQGTQMTSLDHLLLCRMLIAGNWLFKCLSKSVYEHHGITYEKNQLPISIPFVANLKPAKDSEFSDPFRMGINTFMDYYVQGLSLDQTQQLVEFLQIRALKEFEDAIDINPNSLLADTDAYRQFMEILQAQKMKGDLFSIDLKDPQALTSLKNAFHASHPAAFKTVSNYVASKILKHKTLFTELIACNGMNTATMAAKLNGFSATIDTTHIAPMMGVGVKKQMATVEIEEGVYGQWVDELIRKHHNVYIMGEEPHHLFRDVIGNLPANQRKRFRAIMDGGCHFRGISNQDVAKLMCEQLQKLPEIEVEGVLYFDSESDLPFFMNKENPKNTKRVHAFDTKIVDGEERFVDLNLSVNKVAVFFNQDKTSSTNIPLMDDAVVISTVTENTPFFKKMQSDGRARKKEFEQQIITALQKGALSPISTLLKKPALNDLPLGFVSDRTFIKDVILYTFCIRSKDIKPEHFLLCMQNMQNTVQQFLLDFRNRHPDAASSIFTHCASLFKHNIAYDLVRDFGLPKTAKIMNIYLENVITHITRLLEKINHEAFNSSLQETVENALREIKNLYLPVIPETIKISTTEIASSQDFLMLASRESTALQIQENKGVRIAEHAEKSEWKPKYKWSRGPAPRKVIDADTLFSPQFGLKVEPSASQQSLPLQCYSLETLLKSKFSKIGPSPLFSKNLLATENFVHTSSPSSFSKPLRINIQDNLQKPIFQLVLIQDTVPEAKIRTVLVSTEDAQEIADLFKANPNRPLPEGRSMWLLRPSGDLAWPGPSPYSKETLLGNPQILSLLLEINFFSGNLAVLERNFWHQALKAWLSTLPNREHARSFFENSVLRETPKENYLGTKTHKLLSGKG